MNLNIIVMDFNLSAAANMVYSFSSVRLSRVIVFLWHFLFVNILVKAQKPLFPISAAIMTLIIVSSTRALGRMKDKYMVDPTVTSVWRTMKYPMVKRASGR